MTEQEPGSEFRGALAGAREPTADRLSDLPDSANADPEAPKNDLHDISKTLFGAQASTGKAVFSASRMTVNQDAQQHVLHDQQKRKEEREARELANLAVWNSQKTIVGGVEMTNAQAQTARQNVIDNADGYADWAVRKGFIREDQRDGFKTGIQRKKELEDKRGRGTMTATEADEELRLDRSRVGKALEAATARDYQHQGVAPAREAISDSYLQNPTAAVLDRPTLFQSAPDATAAFKMASYSEQFQKPPPQPVAPSIKATGLDL